MSAASGFARRIAADILREELQTDGPPTSTLSDIFDREPIPLQTFITDRAYLHNPPLSPIQYDFIRHLEQIYLPETYIAMVEEFGVEWTPVRMVHMLVAQWGKGGGKDSCCRLGVTRGADLLMCLKNPQRYYGLPDQDDIHLLNVAASSDQARRAFFAPMKRLFTTTPFLSSSFRNDNPPGEMATSILLKKGVELISGHSLADTQEGLNLIIGVADEVSAFKTKDELARAGLVYEGRETKTAEGIVKMLRTSARTRFPTSFKVAQISYPRFKDDAIQQATAIGLRSVQRYGDKSAWYVSGPHATWEVNPRVSDRSVFDEDYDEDPEMAAAMYECRPSGAVNRFMRNDVAIHHAFSRTIPDPVLVEYFWGFPENAMESKMAPAERPGWQVRFHFHSDLQPMEGAAYALHGDLGVTGDRAGVAMSHVRTMVTYERSETGEESRSVVKNDFVFSFEADLKAVSPDGVLVPREVQIRWYRQLVWELLSRGFYVARVTFDGFQSTDMIQVLKAHGIQSEVVSLDRNNKPYQDFQDLIYDNRFEGYFRPRVLKELEGLRRIPGNKVDHSPGGSKDEADALAGSAVGALLVGGDEGETPTAVGEAGMTQFYAAQLLGGGTPSGEWGGGEMFGLRRGDFGLGEVFN